MSRENILFALVGLLLGYVIAFHVVFHINQREPAAQARTASAAGGAAVPTNDVKDRQRLASAAESAAQQARQDPKDFDAQMRAGNAALEAGDSEGAIDFLTRAVELRPADSDAVVRLGHANFEAKRYEAAERWYSEALRKKPEDVDVRSDLGLTFFLREPPQTDRALAEFRRALDYDPQHVPTLHNLTLVQMKTGDLEGAETSLARLEKLDPEGNNVPLLRRELEKTRAAGAEKPAADKKKNIPPAG
ncbi:MAG TPA: tetratricopeptide repeat protein [Pyrinomonadaceae bacterium]|jgi:Flp pilus assembly protein TadD|nr:tetratricopeptide repeat protein [Pyrinomonadaceae bacterium]